jgi:hypothetical protein
MKFHWGHGILIALICIVVGFSIVFMRTFSSEHDNQLITENYYAKELVFQDQIDKKDNAHRANKQIKTQFSEQGLHIWIEPLESHIDSGELVLLRPSEEKWDVTISLENQSDTILISPDKLKKGRYLLQLDWREGNELYFKEISLFVP